MPWAWRWCSARAVPVPVGVFSSPLSPPSTPTSFKMQDQQCKARRSKSMMVNNLCTKWVNMKHNQTYGDIRGFHIALFHRDSQLVSTTLVVQLNRQTQLPLGRGSTSSIPCAAPPSSALASCHGHPFNIHIMYSKKSQNTQCPPTLHQMLGSTDSPVKFQIHWFQYCNWM